MSEKPCSVYAAHKRALVMGDRGWASLTRAGLKSLLEEAFEAGAAHRLEADTRAIWLAAFAHHACDSDAPPLECERLASLAVTKFRELTADSPAAEREQKPQPEDCIR